MKKLTGSDLKIKRMTAGLAGEVICRRAGISRSKLCAIERGYVTPKHAEMARISSVIDELVLAKTILNETARELGLSAVYC